MRSSLVFLVPVVLVAALFLLSPAAFPAPLEITSGSASITDAIGEQVDISGANFHFVVPGTVDADYEEPWLPGTTLNFSGEIGIPMNGAYFETCNPEAFGGPSHGTYNGVTAACISGGLDYSASVLVSPGCSYYPCPSTGTFTATGEVAGLSYPQETELFDVQLAGSGTATLLQFNPGQDHFSALDLSFSDVPAPTPEPSALFLLPTGLLAIFLLRLKRCCCDTGIGRRHS